MKSPDRVTGITYPTGTNPTFSYDVNSNLTGWTDDMNSSAVTINMMLPAIPLACAIGLAHARPVSTAIVLLWLLYIAVVAMFGTALIAHRLSDQDTAFRSVLWSAVAPAGAASTLALALLCNSRPGPIHLLASAIGGIAAANVAFVLWRCATNGQ